MAKQLVVGRVTTVDGLRTIEPLHRVQTLTYQRGVQALVAAARAYSANPNEETLGKLIVAAHRVAV